MQDTMNTKTRLRTLVTALATAALLAAGCVGTVPGGENPPPAGGPDAGTPLPPGPDAGDPGPQAIDVTGMVMDYFASAPLANAQLETEGITPPISAQSDLAGAFMLPDVPVASTFYVRGSMALNYLLTINEPVTVVDQSIENNLYLVSEADAQRQHATVGVEVLPNTGVVFANLVRPDLTPMEGVPLANITLTDALGAPVGDGPYFFGALGDVDQAILVSTAYQGRARVAFLNVPAGEYTLTVIDPSLVEGTPDTIYALTFPTLALSARLVKVGGAGGPGEPPPPPPGMYSFATDVYPILQKAYLGGDGCANCHTLGGVANFLRFDDEATLVLQSIQARPNVINLLDPPASLLLTKPLYEDPPNHPNATWLTDLDPSYQIIMLWIADGARP